jgi:glycosyltransferase involved in cell wall biosynthesis
VATGYGQQTAQLVQRLREAGHDVAVSSYYGLNGGVLEWDGVTVYPGVYPGALDPYGNQLLTAHAKARFGALSGGLILTLRDVWMLDPAALAEAAAACWAPVDHDPVPPGIVDFFERSGAAPIAMSRFGERQLRDAGLAAGYAPHAVDTRVFRPHERALARQTTGLPEGAFVVGMVGVNKGLFRGLARKGFPQALEAFARFRARHDDALLYLHTDPRGVADGMNLPPLAEAHGIPGDSVRYADAYRYRLGYPTEFMSSLFAAMDVLLNPSYSEGFGIPIVEAQACGTPVIVTDWTAMSELTGAGWRVGGTRWWTEQSSFWLLPSVDELEAALEAAYTEASGMRDAAREFAERYDTRRVFDEHWTGVLATLRT